MSQGKPIKLDYARNLAEFLLTELRPFCHRVEVAGSVRRCRMTVNDIEIVLIPKWGKEESPTLFEEDGKDINLALERINILVADEVLTKRTNVNGQTMWGGTNQYASMGGVNIDFFHVHDPAQWGVYFAVRTGPAHISKALMIQRRFDGLLPLHHSVKDWRLLNGNEVLATPEEEDFWRICGFAHMPKPEDRDDLLKRAKVRA